jgi:autotransporter-associated beta strand protein
VIVRFLGGDIATGGTESTINVSGTSYRLHQFTAVGNSTFAPTFAVADLQAIQSGAISGTGALTYNSAGKLILSANNTHSGGTTISAGTLQMGNGGTTGTLGSGNVTNNSALVFNRSDAVTVANRISGSGSVTKLGAESVSLTAANSYNGNTTVSGGTLIVASGGSISSSTSTVSTGAHLKVNGTAGAVIVNGTLSGSGTVGAVTLSSGGTLAVGNSPGLLTAASASWNAGSTFQFEVIDATGVAGTAWDLFVATGVLDLTTISAANKMNLTVLSTALQNYDVDTMYTWTFAKGASLTGAESWISGLDVTDRFAIDSSGFNGSTQPGRGFKVVTGADGGLATLSIQAVPEPSSASLLILGLAAVLARSRRCRR